MSSSAQIERLLMVQSFGEQYLQYRQKVKALARSFSSNVL
jgi:protein-S-isoprenylcysteine O-methyltransferase Ste14